MFQRPSPLALCAQAPRTVMDGPLCSDRSSGQSWEGTGGKASLSQDSCLPQLRGDLGHSRENTTMVLSPPRHMAADKCASG